jgi:hypothetical protein
LWEVLMKVRSRPGAVGTERWGEAWPQVRQEIPKAIAEKWRIQRAGWFN